MKNFYVIIILCFLYTNSIAQCIPTIGWVPGSGGQITFTGSVTGGVPPYTYFWYLGDTNYATTQNTVHTYQYNATYHACLAIQDAFGCYDSICTDVQVNTAALNALCPGDASFTTVANGPVVSFSSPVTNNLVILDFGDGSPPGFGPGLNHTYQLNGNYLVTAISNQIFSGAYLTCDTSVQMISVTTVPCQAAFVLIADTNAYTITGINSSFGDANCTWSLNGVPVANNINYFQTGMLPPGTYTLCIDITGPLGCIDSYCQTATFNYTPACNVAFSYTPSGVSCDTYDFSINNAGPPLTATSWYVDGNFVSGLATTQQTLNFGIPPYYTGYVSVTGVATGPSCTSSWIHTFNNPAFYYIMLDTTGSVNTWYAYPTNYSGMTSVLWDFGDGTTSTLQYPTHVYATAGTYNVCQYITLNGTCSYTYCINSFFFRSSGSNMISNFVVVGPNGINELGVNNLEIYPNPATKTLNIRSASKISEITVMDISGKTIKVIPDINHASFDIQYLQIGIYFLQIKDVNENVVVRKFVKGE